MFSIGENLGENMLTLSHSFVKISVGTNLCKAVTLVKVSISSGRNSEILLLGVHSELYARTNLGTCARCSKQHNP